MSDTKALRKEAFEMFQQGFKLCDIAKQLNVPAGTVRRWKHSDKWEQNEQGERSEKTNKANEQANVRGGCKQVRNDKEKAIAEDVEQVNSNPDLTDKQRLFCLYYIRCFNATKAYQKAYGVDYITACGNASKLLKSIEIKNEIRRLKQNRFNREMLSEADIFQKYMDIAFADITDYVTFGPIKVEDPDTGKKVAVTKMANVIQFKESNEVDGTLISEVKQGKDGASIKLADRMKALEWLTAHMDMATPEQRARMKKLEVETERIQKSGSGDGEDDGVEIINDCPQ